ncbi:MAG: ABC transporter substrate-binding protein [Bacillota bacterium]
MNRWRKMGRLAVVLGLASMLGLTIGLSGCQKSAKKYSGKITIGSETVNESAILANIAKALIEANTNIQVEVISGFNDSEALLHKAMQANQIQIHPTWTGTQLTGVLEYGGPTMDRQKTWDYVKSEYEKRFNMTWTKPFGFNDTYVLFVKQDTATKYNLKTQSDLAAVAKDWVIASDNSWGERELDGYPGWKKTYGIDFKKVAPMDYGLIYRAVDSGDAQVGVGYATDSRMKKMNFVILTDDKGFAYPYDGAFVVSQDLLKQYPKLLEVLEQVSGKIDDLTMSGLNAQFDIDQKDPDVIAKDFLKSIGLIK